MAMSKAWELGVELEGLKRKRGEVEAALVATPEAKRVRKDEAWTVVKGLLGKHGAKDGLQRYMGETGMEVTVTWGRDVDDRKPAYPEVRSWVRATLTTQPGHRMGVHGGLVVDWEAVVVERDGGVKDRFVRVQTLDKCHVIYVEEPGAPPAETFVDVLGVASVGRAGKFWRAMTRPDFSAIERMDVGRKVWGCWASVKPGTVGWDVAQEMRVARDNPMEQAFEAEGKRKYDDTLNHGLRSDVGRGECFMCKQTVDERVEVFENAASDCHEVYAVCQPCMEEFGCVCAGDAHQFILPRHLAWQDGCASCGRMQCLSHRAGWDKHGVVCGDCKAQAKKNTRAEEDYEDEIEAKRIRIAEIEGNYEPGSDSEEEGEITPGEAAVAPMVVCQHEGCTNEATHGYPSDSSGSEADSESDDEGCDDDVACFVLTGSLPRPVTPEEAAKNAAERERIEQHELAERRRLFESRMQSV
jgi:hypothetical protein